MSNDIFSTNNSVETNNFMSIMQFIAKWEWRGREDGALTDDKQDLGGVTKFGIAQKFHPEISVRDLTLKDALQIYYDEYWLGSGADKLPMPLAGIVMDTAVNMGVGRAKQFLKAADGKWWVMMSKRKEYYANRRVADPEHSERFYKGWMNRLNDLDKWATIWEQDNG